MSANGHTRHRPSAGYAITLRVNLDARPGNLGRLATAIGDAGGDIGAVNLVERRDGLVVRDIAVRCADEAHGDLIVDAARAVRTVEVRSVWDRTFELHAGGKIEVASRIAVTDQDALSQAYTPGVGRVSRAIAERPERVWDLTGKQNAVAVLTDGTAVLGLGDIGPEAALPVMEGKALLFKEFGGVDAYPICVRAATAERIVEVAEAIAPGFGGINLEDIAAPACFEVEERLRERLDIPVFHDDQHGTAVVVLAALLNALRLVDKRLEDVRVAILGMGAAGVACARLLLRVGVGDIVGVDRRGVLHPGRPDLNPHKAWIAEHTNREGRRGHLEDALRGADVFIGVSGPGLVRPDWLRAMSRDGVVFAMSNPVPEIMPEDVPETVRVIATGRSDYPNQINNVLAFPGFFRGLLDARATSVTDDMKVAAAHALASLIPPDDLSPEAIVPQVFDPRVAPAVADAVRASEVSAAAAGR